MFQQLVSGLYKTWHLATRSTHPLGSLLNDQRGGFEQREAATKTKPNENGHMTTLETDSAPMANLQTFWDQIFDMGNIKFKL